MASPISDRKRTMTECPSWLNAVREIMRPIPANPSYGRTLFVPADSPSHKPPPEVLTLAARAQSSIISLRIGARPPPRFRDSARIGIHPPPAHAVFRRETPAPLACY